MYKNVTPPRSYHNDLVDESYIYTRIQDYDGIMEAECLYDFTDDGDGCITIRPGMVRFLE